MKIDLHTHTNYSDGTLSPKEIIDYANKINLGAIAITDHDTVDALKEGEIYAKEKNIEFIKGIEISSDYNSDTEIHILGLFIEESKEFELKLKSMKENRQDRNIRLIKLLQDNGFKITKEEVFNLAGGEIVSRAHFAKLLLDKGYGYSMDDIFNRYLGDKGKYYIKRDLPPSNKVIDIIHEAKGIAMLAHPQEYGLNDPDIDYMIRNLKEAGLDGIEAIYTTHNKDRENHFIQLANNYDLQISGGSDFHGDNKPDIDLGTGFGNLEVDYKVLENLKEYHSKKYNL